MAAVSATSVRLGSSLTPATLSNQQYGRAFSMKSVNFSSTKFNAPSLKSSGFQIVCAAKPETVGKVMEIVKEQLALSDETALTPDSTFSALGADSLDTVEIVMQLEESFDISIEEDNSQNITTVQDAADLIEKLVQKKTEAA